MQCALIFIVHCIVHAPTHEIPGRCLKAYYLYTQDYLIIFFLRNSLISERLHHNTAKIIIVRRLPASPIGNRESSIMSYERER